MSNETGNFNEPYSDTIDRLKKENAELLEVMKTAVTELGAGVPALAYDTLSNAIKQAEGK